MIFNKEKFGEDYFKDLSTKLLVLFTDKFSEVFDKSTDGRFNSHINHNLHMFILEKEGQYFKLVFEEYNDNRDVEKLYYYIPSSTLKLSKTGVITGDKASILDAYYKVIHIINEANLSMRGKLDRILTEISHILYIDDVEVNFNEEPLPQISDEDENRLQSKEARMLASLMHRQLSDKILFLVRTKLSDFVKKKVMDMITYDDDDNNILQLSNGRYTLTEWDSIEDPIANSRYISDKLIYTINQKIKRKADVIEVLNRLESNKNDLEDFKYIIKALEDLMEDDDLYKW